MTLHILSVNDEELTIVLQALLATKNPQAKEVAIRFKNMATPAVVEEEECDVCEAKGNEPHCDCGNCDCYVGAL